MKAVYSIHLGLYFCMIDHPEFCSPTVLSKFGIGALYTFFNYCNYPADMGVIYLSLPNSPT